MTSVYLGTPTTRDFSPQYVASLWMTQFKGSMTWQPVIGQAVDIGRNVVCERFLKSGMDYLLMHDSDATWKPLAIQRLVDRALPVVTGVIFKRGLPTVPMIGVSAGRDPEGSHLYGFAHTVNRLLGIAERERLTTESENEQVLDMRTDDLEEIDGAGAHFMLIRRDVIEKIGAPWYVSTSINAGEDFDFCRRVKKAGFKMYVDYSVLTGHVVGPGVEFGIKQFLMFRDARMVNEPWKM